MMVVGQVVVGAGVGFGGISIDVHDVGGIAVSVSDGGRGGIGAQGDESGGVSGILFVSVVLILVLVLL
jgi:hypothetical protein